MQTTQKKLFAVSRAMNHDLDAMRAIGKWKESIGLYEAERIMAESQQIGSALHALLEAHFTEKPEYIAEIWNDIPNESKTMFHSLRQWADDNIKELHYIEQEIECEELGLRGIFDCLATTKDGRLCVIDWKNSRKPKKEEHVKSYILQCVCYAAMIALRFDTEPTHYIVPIVTPDGKQQIFEGEITDDLYEEMLERLSEYFGSMTE